MAHQWVDFRSLFFNYKKRRSNFAPLTRARPGRIFRICSPYCLISPLSFATFLSTDADLPSVCKKVSEEEQKYVRESILFFTSTERERGEHLERDARSPKMG
jgi:hypothetical protein